MVKAVLEQIINVRLEKSVKIEFGEPVHVGAAPFELLIGSGTANHHILFVIFATESLIELNLERQR